MKILANKDIRNLFLAVSVIWAASLLLAQGFLWLRYQRLSLCLLFIFLLAAAAIWVVCCSYFKKQNKIMEQAVSQINVYLDGDSNARIECDSEGELYRLFHSVNSLAAVLNAHADNELREKEFLKNTISDISHQLKTPLAVIKTNIDVLRLDETPEPEEYEKTLTVIERQLKRMMTLVDNLFAMTAQHSYDFNDTVDFDRMFRDIIAELTPRIREKNLEINLHHSGFHTIANSVMLTRAFSNLVENAVKYNIEGGRIDISTESEDKRYVITIADNGIGIPSEKLENIFKPFYRADESRSGTDGAGLGLAIASEIITAHGGTISARSQEGQTVFTVMLPII